jgi:hypothetical protein
MPEDSFHATVFCTKARALRDVMRKHWKLPDENEFKYTGKDWLLVLLSNQSKTDRGFTLLLL